MLAQRIQLIDRPIIRDGLVRWYPMDEGAGSTLRDMASGYNASLAGSYAWETPGVDFDGSTARASASRTGAHPTGSFTITARIRPDGWGGGDYGRIIQAGVTNTSGVLFYVYKAGLAGVSNTLAFSINATVWTYANNDVISIGSTYRLAIVYIPGTSASFYINGSLDVSRPKAVGNVTWPTVIENTTADIIIGDRPEGSRKFNGMISDLRFYHIPLSAKQIMAIASGNG